MDLAAQTSPTVGEANADTAFCPIGSTEQHGPHAPLGTDTLTAEAIAHRAAKEATSDVVVTPAIPIGISSEHRHFPGTLWVQPDTFRHYVRDVISSLTEQGFESIVLINGHGGNTDALREVAAAQTRNSEVTVVAVTWFETIDEPPVEMGHGGPLETSFLLAHHPELIDESALERAHTEGSERWGQWAGGVNLAYDTIEFSANGVVGDPTLASRAIGEAITEAAVENILTVVEAIQAS